MSNFVSKHDLKLMRPRIDSGKIRSSDLRYDNVLTEEEISSIPEETIFQWIKENQIGIREFRKWVNSFSEAVLE
jgi:hypothetical protein